MDINSQRTNNNSIKLNSFVSNRTSVTKLKIGGNVTGRIVAGLAIRHNHLWPTLVEDKGGATLKSTWRGASVDGDSRDPLDIVSEVDKALQAQYLKSTGGDPSRAMSIFKKRTVYLYAWIKREQGKPPEVGILEANWTIANEIDNLRKKISPTSPDMLYYGLPYMYDICISKYQNPKTGRPAYTVDPFQCQTEGKIPIKYLEEEKYPIEDKTQFFSSEDLAAIESCNWELKDQDVPITSAELIDRISQYPIDLSRRTRDGKNFMFFRTQNELRVIETALSHEGIYYISPQPVDIQSLPEGDTQYTHDLISGIEGTPNPNLQIENNAQPQQAPVNTQQVPVNTQQVPVNTQQAPVNTQQVPVNTQQVPVNTAPTQANPVPPVGVGNSVNPANPTQANPGINPTPNRDLPFNGQPQQISVNPQQNKSDSGMPEDVDW